MIKILAIPGSLRDKSSSNQILGELVLMALPNVTIEIFRGIGDLPHFNDPENVPLMVSEFKEKIRASDAVLICTPEYAFGVPGSLKNALDWTVSSGEFIDKPVALITASSQGEKGHAALLLILKAISARVIEDATLLISFVRAKLDTNGKIKDQKVSSDLASVMHALVNSVQVKNSSVL